jgi:uncharacterized protein YktA (UPF0223 family)
MNDYQIDFEMFTTEEIVKIYAFFGLIEQTKHRKLSKNLLREKYREYRNIINNKALEKKYDKMVREKSGVSIFETMKALLPKKEGSEK